MLIGTAGAAIGEGPLIPRSALSLSDGRSNARLSPDGRYIAFVASNNGQPNIWLAPVDDFTAARQITDDRRRGISHFTWAFDSLHLLFSQDEDGNGKSHYFSLNIESGKRLDLIPIDNATVANRGGENWLSPERQGTILLLVNEGKTAQADLYEVDVATGERRLLLRDEQAFNVYYADRKLRPVAAQKIASGGRRELYRRSDDGWERVLEWDGMDAGLTSALTVEPGGSTLLMRSSIGRNHTALVRLDLATGRQVVLAEDPKASLVDIWTEPRTGKLEAYVTAYLTSRTTPLTPAAASDLRNLQAALGTEINVVSRTLDNRRWIVDVNEPRTGVSSHLYDRETGRIVKLFDVWPKLANAPLQRMWPLEIPARDGLMLVSYVTLPPGSDPDGHGRPERPVPLVMIVHPGPASRDEYRFRDDHQWLANRGYAVLSVNFRGSILLGKEFYNAGHLEIGGKMQDDLIDAIDWAIREGIADAAKIAIFGSSYGGYATLSGLAFTPDRFACGIDLVGPTNLLDMFDTPMTRTSRPVYQAAVDLMGDPTSQAVRQRLEARSPLTHAARIVRPLLVAHGGNDPAVPRDQSDRLVEALKARDRPVTYIVYPNEGHALQRPQNRISFFAVAEAFLAQCLGGRAEPFGDDLEGANLQVVEGIERIAGLAHALRDATASASPSPSSGAGSVDGR